MGFYYSLDGRWITCSLDDPPYMYLTDKGRRDTKAAIILQRWFRKLKKQNKH